MGLFPPGAPEPGRVQLPRASEAQAHSRPVVCALELIFPQKQSSSGGWLLAWLQGTVLSSQLQPQTFTPPHCLRLAGALMGASETTDRHLCRGPGAVGTGARRKHILFKLFFFSFWGVLGIYPGLLVAKACEGHPQHYSPKPWVERVS